MRGLKDGQREGRNDRHKESAEGRHIVGEIAGQNIGHPRVASGAGSGARS